MDDKTHNRLVNTHTEGNGGNDDINLLHQEVILSLGKGSRIKARMIRRSLDFIGLQNLCQLLNLLTGKTIDDAALTRMLTDKLDDLAVNIIGFLAHFIIQIRSVERAFILQCIQNAQILLDIRAHLVGSRSSKSNDRSLPNLVNNRTDTTILRAEIMSPLRNTMSLIYSIERNLDGLQELHVILLCQGLRSHIKQFRFT